MTLFGHGLGTGLDSRSSPILSPTRWTLNSRRPARSTLTDGLAGNDHSWLPSRRRYGDDTRYQMDLLPSLSSRLDMLSKPSDPLLHGSTPEIRALRSRIMDSPGHSGALDVPLYLRSVENRRLTHTPKRNAALDLGTASPRRNTDYLNEDLGFKFSSPLLSGRNRFRRNSRGSARDLKIGAYTTPRSDDRFGTVPSYRTERNLESSKLYKTSPIKNRINIHATDDILNRIKRGLSECESITKRLDKQYGSRSSQIPPLDYSERVFPRALADNLFSNRSSAAPIYRNKVNINRTNIAPAGDDTSVRRDSGEREQPKSTLTRILENIKRIRNRSLFSDEDGSIGKRKFVEIEKPETEPPRLTTQRNKSLNVDAIQQRIKQQKRNLLSQRNWRNFD